MRILLGVAADGVVYFGVDGPLRARTRGGTRSRRPRCARSGRCSSDRDAGLMTHAVALGNFHDSHHFCPHCGEPSVPVYVRPRAALHGGGHRASSHAVDPAMIVLVTDPADRGLLARNAAWPAHRVSILAGFVEAGESAEQAVAREVQEEVGIAVGEVHYLGSQPWPMPQSLMLGFRAEATGSMELKVDDDEIAEAGWYSRDELTAAVADGTIRLPPPVSIAHQIIQSWFGREVPGSW